MSVARLTGAEARTMTRAEAGRVYAEMAGWEARPPRTGAQRAAYGQMMAIMRAYVDLAAGLGAIRGQMEGRPDDYWGTTPQEERYLA